MLKRTIYVAQPYHISLKLNQLLFYNKETCEERTVPLEDLGFILFDNERITLTQQAIRELSVYNVAAIFCDQKHHPASMLLHLDVNSVQQERFRAQINASEPLKKQLWKQTIQAKILNQASFLEQLGKNPNRLLEIAKRVRSGDPDNCEGTAAKDYWPRLFGKDFSRGRFNSPPNNFLNYGYTILRAAVARALTGSGLLPTLGIHHHNKYNAFCLADDIMEPLRPWVDFLVWQIVEKKGRCCSLDSEDKKEFLQLLVQDSSYKEQQSPLMVVISHVSRNLAACFEGTATKLIYPKFTLIDA